MKQTPNYFLSPFTGIFNVTNSCVNKNTKFQNTGKTIKQTQILLYKQKKNFNYHKLHYQKFQLIFKINLNTIFKKIKSLNFYKIKQIVSTITNLYNENNKMYHF